LQYLGQKRKKVQNSDLGTQRENLSENDMGELNPLDAYVKTEATKYIGKIARAIKN